MSFSRSEKRLSFTLNGDRSPSDLYTLAIGQGAPVRLTTSLQPDMDAADLVDTQVVRFKSFDGMAIPNILFKPHQATASAKAPALVWVHGGPGGQTTRGYSAITQYLANHGYVVLGINNRGSSGYGKSFFAADDQKHGREPLWDCVEAKKYLASLPYVDADRVGIIGGSYGGYMVLAALAFKPDVFDVGVDIFGVSNWLRTLEGIPRVVGGAAQGALRRDRRPGSDQKEMLREISPALHARQDPQAADRAPGRQRPARHQGGIGRHRGRGEEERRPGRVRRVSRRGPRVQQARQRDLGLRRDPAVPRRAPQGQGEDQAGGAVRGTALGATVSRDRWLRAGGASLQSG